MKPPYYHIFHGLWFHQATPPAPTPAPGAAPTRCHWTWSAWRWIFRAWAWRSCWRRRGAGKMVEKWRKPWENLGKIGGNMVENWWTNDGKMVDKWWKNGVQIMEKWWTNDGKMVDKWWKEQRWEEWRIPLGVEGDVVNIVNFDGRLSRSLWENLEESPENPFRIQDQQSC